MIAAHKITSADIARLKNSETTDEARKKIIDILKQNIGWNELNTLRPSEHEHSTSFATTTGLFGLSKERIALLSKEAEWKMTLQVKLYLPMLVN